MYIKLKMTNYIKEKGYEARAFYLNALYVLFILLGSLFAATLNAEEHFHVDAAEGPDFSLPRYMACKLNGTASHFAGAGDDGVCIRFDRSGSEADEFTPTEAEKGEADILQQLFNISVAAAVVNGILFAHSVLMHWRGFGISVHFMLQWAFSLVNVGLFAGLVGWLGGVEKLNDEMNIENNVYFKDINIFAVAVAGLVIAVLDLAGSNLVIYWACKSYKCWSINE